MKKALVLGITGGFGGHVARALLADGWQVTALVRDASKVSEDFATATIIEADATNEQALIEHGQGCSVLVYGLNPQYKDWAALSLLWLNTSLKAAKTLNARLVFPANVYNFNPSQTPVIDETSPMQAVDHKGHIRIAQERAIEEFVQQGGKALLLRCGDYLAKDAPSAWFNMLIKPNKVTATNEPSTQHSWAYLPDVGESVARLLATELEDHSVYHFAGHNISFNDWHAAIGGKISRFPWWALYLAAPFMPNLREVIGMRYLWRQPLALDNTKLVKQIGGEPHTPLVEVIQRELAP